MTSRDLVYWLMGYMEIHNKNEGLTAEQVDCIKRHLALVFVHEIDPADSPDPKVQEQLNATHGPRPSTGGMSQGLTFRC